jgi:hypothetical protein
LFIDLLVLVIVLLQRKDFFMSQQLIIAPFRTLVENCLKQAPQALESLASINTGATDDCPVKRKRQNDSEYKTLVNTRVLQEFLKP